MKQDAARALADLQRLTAPRVLPFKPRKRKPFRMSKFARLYVAGRLFCQWW